MIPHLRSEFNRAVTPESHRRFLADLDRRCGTHVKFRICETPCFFPASLLDELAAIGAELLRQLVESREYHAASGAAVPPAFNVPRETPHPLFAAVDFGLVRAADGRLEPKLVEIQGFPSLYAFQVAFAEQYVETYRLDPALRIVPGGVDLDAYNRALRRAILGAHAAENVVLMEFDPLEQKTLPDFLLTERVCGIRTVNVRDIIKEGSRLFYTRDGKRVPIRRIYNRAIVDELVRKQVKLPFDFRDDLDVEWAGHPNWFFRISKFSIPHLRHACVPKTWFLDELPEWPGDLENYVLKPLYSFAGIGVIVGPARADLEAVPAAERHNFILQERLAFEPIIETPHGPTKAEIRILYIWLDQMHLGPAIIRMGRGKMMGVDHNRDMEWVGASAGLIAAGS